MISIILAAGEGSRLLPYTKDVPKSLVQIRNTTMLEEQLKIYDKLNIKSYIVGGYLFNKLKVISNNLFENKFYLETNMVYTLFEAQSIFNDDIIISYGDILFTKNILNDLIKSKKNVTVVADMNWKKYWLKRLDNPLDDLETFIKSGDRIKELGGKANSINEIEGQFIGLLKVSKNFLTDLIKIYEDCKLINSINGKPYKKAFMTDFIQEIINRRFEVNFIEMFDPWVEIDTVDDLNNVETKKEYLKLLK